MRSNPKRKEALLHRLLNPLFWEEVAASKKKADKAYLRSDFWNIIAEEYDDLEENPFYQELQSDILQEMEKRGALEREYTFFDLCCGTGSYTIKVAPKVSQVFALDISPQMLEVLRRKVQSLGLNNITIIEADWKKYEPPQAFDTVLVSMTPILRDLKEVKRILQYTKKYFIAVQWAGLRKNFLMEEIEKRFFKRIKEEKHPGLFLLFNYLYTLGKPGDVKFYQGFLKRRAKVEKFWERLKFRLLAKGYTIGPRKEKLIKQFLEDKAKEGFIENTSEVRIGAIFLKI